MTADKNTKQAKGALRASPAEHPSRPQIQEPRHTRHTPSARLVLRDLQTRGAKVRWYSGRGYHATVQAQQDLSEDRICASQDACTYACVMVVCKYMHDFLHATLSALGRPFRRLTLHRMVKLAYQGAGWAWRPHQPRAPAQLHSLTFHAQQSSATTPAGKVYKPAGSRQARGGVCSLTPCRTLARACRPPQRSALMMRAACKRPGPHEVRHGAAERWQRRQMGGAAVIQRLPPPAIYLAGSARGHPLLPVAAGRVGAQSVIMAVLHANHAAPSGTSHAGDGAASGPGHLT